MMLFLEKLALLLPLVITCLDVLFVYGKRKSTWSFQLFPFITINFYSNLPRKFCNLHTHIATSTHNKRQILRHWPTKLYSLVIPRKWFFTSGSGWEWRPCWVWLPRPPRGLWGTSPGTWASPRRKGASSGESSSPRTSSSPCQRYGNVVIIGFKTQLSKYAQLQCHCICYELQGDTSCCFQPPIDNKTKVVF